VSQSKEGQTKGLGEGQARSRETYPEMGSRRAGPARLKRSFLKTNANARRICENETSFPSALGSVIKTRLSKSSKTICPGPRVPQRKLLYGDNLRLLQDTRSSLPAVHHPLSGFRSPQSIPPTSQVPSHPQNTKHSFTTFHQPRLSPLLNQRPRSCH
jgi:hypothetical protein